MTSVTGNARGYTLIELLVVMAILVTMAAMLPLAFERSLPSRRVAVSTQRIITTIHAAQADSVSSGQVVKVTLVDAQTLNTGPFHIRFPSQTSIKLSAFDGRPMTEVSLYPDGSAAGAQFEVSEAAHRAVVRISEVTGRVALVEPK